MRRRKRRRARAEAPVAGVGFAGGFAAGPAGGFGEGVGHGWLLRERWGMSALWRCVERGNRYGDENRIQKEKEAVL